MSEKINLRMLDPKPLVLSDPSAKAVSTLTPDEDVDVVEKLDQAHQVDRSVESEPQAWLGGAIGALAGAAVTALVAATVGLWVSCVGIGFAVAFGVRKLGKGSTQRFGIIGATCAFVGCVIAYHVAWVFVLAREQGVPVMEFVRSVQSWSDFVIGVLGPRDFAIYAGAMAAGYKFSYSSLSDEY